METKVLNNSNYLTVEAYLSNPHNPTIVEVNEDVKLEYEIGKDELGNPIYKEVTLRFSAGDILFFNGGTLNKGILSGTAKLKVMSERMFQVDSNGHSTVTFDQSFQLNVPYLRPEWFGAKGNLVFERNGDNFTLNEDPSYYDNFWDDSVAINETIRVAEELSIKTVKFNAVNYLVKAGIKIYKGNLRLEGSGALLREEQWMDISNGTGGRGRLQIWNTRTSTLFCPKGGSLITLGEELVAGKDPVYPVSQDDSVNPADPVIISDLQLWTAGNVWEYDIEKDKLTSGINFCSNFAGPLWPLIIERCHFRNFYYAVHINTRIDYPVTNLRIDECAFSSNMYCLFSERRDKTATTGVVELEPTLQTSWSLEFTRNKCHNNGFVMKMCVNKGPCRVEYNNLESAKGFNREDKSEPGVFAIDLELGQRAAAVIRYNHFEVSRPRLARVKGFWGLNWVTMLHNNTDGNIGEYAASNLCYFDSVVLNTDEDAEVHNCIIEDAPYNGKSLRIAEALDAGNANRFPIGSVYLRGLPARPLVDGSIKGYYKVNPNAATAECSHAYMQTPMGKMLMRYFYEKNVTYEHNLVVMQQDFDYDYYHGLKMPFYVTIDFPLINEFKMQPLVIFNQLQYAGSQDIKNSYTYLYFDKGGFFNVRQQFRLDSDFDKVNIQLAVRAGTRMPIEGRFFIGKIVVMFSNTPLDMNYSLMDDRSVDLAESDSYLLRKGDFVTVGGKKYICHTEGYKCAGTVAFSKAADSNVISVGNTILPLGSIWKYGSYKFKVISPKDYVTHNPGDGAYRYTGISYVVETNAFAVALNGNMQCSEPGLTSL